MRVDSIGRRPKVSTFSNGYWVKIIGFSSTFFERYSIKPRIDVIEGTATELLEKLALESGYKQTGSLCLFQMDPSKGARSSHATDSVSIELLKPSRSRNFLDVISLSIGKTIDEEILAKKSTFYCTENFRCYVASIGGDVAGFATMYVSDYGGWLANAFTFDRFRRQGVQSALLSRRIADAALLGLRSIYTDVEPGSDSMRNVERFGFNLMSHMACWSSDR